jgi:hypothetical protein
MGPFRANGPQSSAEFVQAAKLSDSLFEVNGGLSATIQACAAPACLV